MLPYGTKLIAGLLGTAFVATFVIGLAHSISTGFAGFWGGLPFTLIVAFVLSLALYDFWDECVRRKDK
jgi:sterol desaturase/sphingolipid hydroxylase (fatty acid hydroxylase superfamily)